MNDCFLFNSHASSHRHRCAILIVDCAMLVNAMLMKSRPGLESGSSGFTGRMVHSAICAIMADSNRTIVTQRCLTYMSVECGKLKVSVLSNIGNCVESRKADETGGFNTALSTQERAMGDVYSRKASSQGCLRELWSLRECYIAESAVARREPDSRFHTPRLDSVSLCEDYSVSVLLIQELISILSSPFSRFKWNASGWALCCPMYTPGARVWILKPAE